MVMIEKKRHACAHERKIINETHIGKHLHLMASLHLKHRVHMEVVTSTKGDAGSSSQAFLTMNEGLMQELSTLQKSPVFRDPPMSPSCENLRNEMVLRRCEVLAISSKEAGAAQLISSNKIENVPYHTENYARKENKRGSHAPQREKKIRRKRVKVLSIKSNKGAASMERSARASFSLQSSKALSSAKGGVTLPSAKGGHLFDIDGLLENECTAPWNSSRVYSKAIQVSGYQYGKHVELGLAEKSSPCENAGTKLTETTHMLYTSCRRDDLDPPTSLSVKYSPKSLCDILGQHLVTQALSNALSKGRVAPMYVFYGPRGTGKTSCAKLFALALNCLSRGDRPCGTCRLCVAQISGKLSPIKEVKAGKAYRVKEVASLMEEISWSSSFLYKVCIVDECQALSVKVWNTLLKGIKAASKKTVFIFSTESIEHIPHAIVSQCQRFHFSKIKESDIIDKLQMIALQESLEADFEAIRLIASACNGSLYDAELMLDHIRLLGKSVKVPVVQDLVGLISDSTLMELLDSALSANIVNTIQSLKTFHESGVEPLNLVSQLASLITRILAGGYRVPKRKLKGRFFRSKELTKDNMQRLRRALRILSEAEKQLRGSSSRMTWLIAALLQFAPDRSYIASSCPHTSPTHSPVTRRMDSIGGIPEGSENLGEAEKQSAFHSHTGAMVPINNVATNSSNASTINSSFHRSQISSVPKLSQRLANAEDMPCFEAENARAHLDNNREIRSTERDDLEQVWQRVLDAINSTNLQCFLRTQGKLVSLSLHKDFEALLEFHHLEHLSRVQRSKASILHAFEATLGHRVKVKVHLVSRTNEYRMRQNSWKHEEANIDVVPLATVMCGRGRSDVKLKTGEGSVGQKHKETELEELHEPHRVYAIEGTPHNAQTMQSWSQANCSSLDNDISLGYVLTQKAEGSVEGYSVDLQFDDINTTSKRDSTRHHMYLHASQSRNSALVAAKLQEKNLRMESTSKSNVCWEAANNACSPVECYEPCSKHSKFILGFFPCASI